MVLKLFPEKFGFAGYCGSNFSVKSVLVIVNRAADFTPGGFAQKILKVTSDDLCKEMFLAQRRNDATKPLGNAVALCVVAPLREKSFLV